VKEEDIIPDISPFIFYVDSFHELSTCRVSISGLSPIPFSAIMEYCKMYRLEDEDREDFIFFIREMDKELLSIEAEKDGRSSKKNTSSR